MKTQRTVLIAEDLCCAGRAALTVSIPVIAAYGLQPCPVLTAAFSEHTGFENPVKRDMTDFFAASLSRFEERAFSALMTGYLLNPDQAALLDGFISKARKNIGLILIDPAMADNGKLYGGISQSMPAAYQRLMRFADIITPNATEAAILTDRSPAHPLLRGGVDGLFSDLSSICPGAIVVKGLNINGETVNACARAGGDINISAYKKRPGNYPGTGDLFKSVLLGETLSGANLKDATRRAAEFVGGAVDAAIAESAPPNEGLPFEKLLHILLAERL